jgi:hypothetical protein
MGPSLETYEVYWGVLDNPYIFFAVPIIIGAFYTRAQHNFSHSQSHLSRLRVRVVTEGVGHEARFGKETEF